MEERIAQLERDLAELKAEYYRDNLSTSQTIRKDLTIAGRLSMTGDVGFYNETPVAQQASVAPVNTPSGIYVQAEANNAVTAINLLITRLQSYGLLP